MIEPFKGAVPPWRAWGPYVLERAWGTVREDYSPDGDAWNYLTHDKARSKAYRWGEDGIAGICDRFQLLTFALALWNGRDPILKERMFGLSATEGNHGEDVKEYYFYLDNTPTHSYMKMLYKYPQGEFPYRRLVEENGRRAGAGPEFELLDTGVFDENRYFDVFVEYAKASPEDICVRITAFNRGPEDADLQLLPHLWFRNTWAWTDPPGPEPSIRPGPTGEGFVSLSAEEVPGVTLNNLKYDYRVGRRYLFGPPGAELLFTDNETNAPRVYGPWAVSRKQHVKDAFHRYVINGENSLNSERAGTKACMRYKLRVAAGGSATLRLRLTSSEMQRPLNGIDSVFRQRKKEADEFYGAIQPQGASAEEKSIQRQALAGMLWSKAVYIFDVTQWLQGDNPRYPPPASRKRIRNSHWHHLNSMRVLSLPDKWEFPWFACWDLAFHCVTLALVDPQAARDNLWVMLFEQFQHPSGQIPAYEWEFSDLHPPVHAWACWRIYKMEKKARGRGNRDWLEKCFHKLLINFAWWVNRVDSQGLNIFEGGFLGLDNIAVVDRSEKLPGGAILEQSDATGWLGFFCLNMMRIALELSNQNSVYEDLATKFFEHFIYIGAAMKKMGGRNYQLWDEEDGFFYDVLRYHDGTFEKLRLRSLVGLIPMFAVEILEEEDVVAHPQFIANVGWFMRNRPELMGAACFSDERDGARRHLLSIVDSEQLRRILQRLWDPNEFLSPYGIRSLSKYHEKNPFVLGRHEGRYEPGEASTKIKGGNSNWRGPVWFPTSFILLESLLKFGEALGPDFLITAPGSPGCPVTLREMAEGIARRMISLFKRDGAKGRPIFAGMKKFDEDPYWKDCVLFNEYFHGDTGAGLGANHQTGWTGLIANLIQEWHSLESRDH